MDNTIEELRTFFRCSNAVLEATNSIRSAFSAKVAPCRMHELHKKALVELEKENPDLEIIDRLLLEMENAAALSEQSKGSE